jgi:hypothetical protein
VAGLRPRTCRSPIRWDVGGCPSATRRCVSGVERDGCGVVDGETRHVERRYLPDSERDCSALHSITRVVVGTVNGELQRRLILTLSDPDDPLAVESSQLTGTRGVVIDAAGVRDNENTGGDIRLIYTQLNAPDRAGAGAVVAASEHDGRCRSVNLTVNTPADLLVTAGDRQAQRSGAGGPLDCSTDQLVDELRRQAATFDMSDEWTAAGGAALAMLAGAALLAGCDLFTSPHPHQRTRTAHGRTDVATAGRPTRRRW